MSERDMNITKSSILNSFLLAVCLGVMGWVAHKTAENSEQLAAVRPSLESLKEATSKAEALNSGALVRVERKIDETVPRREFEARLLVIETELHKSDIRLREIDLELLKLKQGLK